MDIKTKKYLEIIKLNNQLKKNNHGPNVKINILGNITLNKLKDILELPLRNCHLSPEIKIGNYDNLLQDSSVIDNDSIVIVFQEIANFFPNIESESICWDDSKINSIASDIKTQLSLVFTNLTQINLLFLIVLPQRRSFQLSRNFTAGQDRSNLIRFSTKRHRK